MTALRLAGLSIVTLMATQSASAQDSSAAKAELAPTGKLRVAIAVGPTPSGIYALKDEATGSYRGVTIDLSTELAKKLDVPIEYLPYRGSGEIQAAGSRILDGGFLNATTAIAVPKGRPAALAYVTAFIEEAKASGLVRRGFDSVGLTSAQVAPAGMKP